MNHTSIGLLSLYACVVLSLSSTASGDDPTSLHPRFHSTILDDGNDLIFPSVIRAADHFEAPLARWYLYTSPHRGADIRLYTADAITGPWTLHDTVVGPDTGRSDHVSSPHAIWNDLEDCLFLYVHAPNRQTIFCRSTDGIHFEYGGVCVTSDMVSEAVGFESKSASYARVYKHRIPEYGNRYTMTLTASGGTEQDGTKQNAIALCTSDDGIHWTARRKLIDDGDGGRTFKCLDAALLPSLQGVQLVYGMRSRADEGKTEGYDPVKLHLVEGDANWRNWTDRGVFYDPSTGHPDRLCARGALFVEDGDDQWLLYEAGPKNNARIALLKLEMGPPTAGASD